MGETMTVKRVLVAVAFVALVLSAAPPASADSVRVRHLSYNGTAECYNYDTGAFFLAAIERRQTWVQLSATRINVTGTATITNQDTGTSVSVTESYKVIIDPVYGNSHDAGSKILLVDVIDQQIRYLQGHAVVYYSEGGYPAFTSADSKTDICAEIS
jgi:hypothetical protein